MKNIKKSYIIIFALVLIFVISFGASYAIFMDKSEQHGKLNIVAGDLDYKIESDDLVDNKITVGANEIKEITIKLSSLNDIDSKYELFYTLDKTNANLRVGYSIDTKDSISGTINANSAKTITIVIRNESDNDSTITFDTIGGLVNNDLILTEGNSLNQVVGKYTAYNIGDEITLTDGSKWHVLEESDETQENVVLLSDYNLNSDGTYNDECGSDIDENYACSTMAYDTDNTNIYDENDSNNIGYFIKNTYSPLVTASLPGTTNITIPTAEQIALADGQEYVSGSLLLTNSKWLVTSNYWTRNNTSNSIVVLIVYGADSSIYGHTANFSTFCGTRPTITTPKSNIVNTISSTTELSIGTSVEAIDGSKWHVLEASGSDSRYVTLLSDYNLNSDGSYALNCTLAEYGSCAMAFDVDNTNTYDVADSNNIGYFIKNTYSPLITKSLPETTNITLPTAEQIVNADNQVFQNQGLGLTTSWLVTTNYWTKSANTTYTNIVWAVYGIHSTINDGNTSVSDVCGARPVITTLKTNLLDK